MIKKIDSFIDIHLEHINESLNELILENPKSYHSQLFQAARYSLLSGGKRLRPLLCIAAGLSFNADIEKLLMPSCALELVHTYSLIHDDLPCMDDDDLRRGKPTLHKIYSEGHAVLTGDYLLTYAFEVLSQAPLLSETQKLQLIHILATRAGSEGMIGGQVVDLSSEGKKIDFEHLKFMHLGKTAALISASLEFGAVIAEISKKDRVELVHAGTYLGLAFQFMDDILDVEEASTDSKKNKATAISLIGLEKSKAYAEEYFQLALHSFHNLSRPVPLLLELSRKFIPL